MATDTPTQMLDFADATDAALGEARKMAEAITTEREKIASIIPHRLEAIKQSGLVQANELEYCREKMSSHEGALEMIQNLLTIRTRDFQKWAEERRELEQKAELNHHGEGIPATKTANGKPAPWRMTKTANDNFVGRRLGEGELAESDIALMQGLHLPLPDGISPLE